MNYIKEVPNYKRASYFGDPISNCLTIDLNLLIDLLLRVNPSIASSAKQAVIFLLKGALNALYKGYKYSFKYYNKYINIYLLIYISLGIRYCEKSSFNYSLDLLNNLDNLYLGLQIVVLYLYILLDLEVKLLFSFLYSRVY